MVLLIGVCGRTASGKTTMSKKICNALTEKNIQNGLIQMDDMYRELTNEEHEAAVRGDYDFDQLDAFDLMAFKEQLLRAAQRLPVHFKDYNHATHQHNKELIVLPAADVWVVEGLYLFADPSIASLFDLKIFMDVDADTSLIRRIRRDCIERDRTVSEVLNQYERYVKPAYERLVEPFRTCADMTIQRGIENLAAFDVMIHFIQSKQQLGRNFGF